MAASDPSRDSGQCAPEVASPARTSLPSGAAALSIRLWRARDSAAPQELSWESNDPAVYLTLDMISASQGVTSPIFGSYLLAAFADIQPAILTARRLQWAIQGLSEAVPFSGTSCAVMVHATEDLPGLEADPSVLGALERCTPGQTLLTAKAAELLQNLPGLPLQASSEPDLHELAWRSDGETWSREADDEALAEIIKKHESEIGTKAGAEGFAAIPMPDLPRNAPEISFRPSAVTLALSGDESEAAEIGRRRKRPWMIGVACVALLAIAILAALVVSHRGTAPTTASPAAASLPATPQPSPAAPPAPIQNPVPDAAAHALQPAPTPSAPSPKVHEHEKTAPADAVSSQSVRSQAGRQKAAEGKCNLDPQLIPSALNQAELSRDEGKYSAAERQFRSVLACEPENARAKSGLERVLQTKQAEH